MGSNEETDIKYVGIRISEEAKILLEKKKPATDLSLQDLASMYVSIGTSFDLQDEGWEERIKKSIDDLEAEKERENIYSSLDKSCPALAFGKDAEKKELWRCVWFREDGPPIIRKLGGTESLRNAACLACDKTGEIITGLRDRDARINELEKGLKAKASERFKIPKCNSGAVLNHDKEDRMIFTNCPKNRSGPVSIKNYCRVLKNGLPCFMFAEITVGVGLRE